MIFRVTPNHVVPASVSCSMRCFWGSLDGVNISLKRDATCLLIISWGIPSRLTLPGAWARASDQQSLQNVKPQSMQKKFGCSHLLQISHGSSPVPLEIRERSWGGISRDFFECGMIDEETGRKGFSLSKLAVPEESQERYKEEGGTMNTWQRSRDHKMLPLPITGLEGSIVCIEAYRFWLAMQPLRCRPTAPSLEWL